MGWSQKTIINEDWHRFWLHNGRRRLWHWHRSLPDSCHQCAVQLRNMCFGNSLRDNRAQQAARLSATTQLTTPHHSGYSNCLRSWHSAVRSRQLPRDYSILARLSHEMRASADISLLSLPLGPRDHIHAHPALGARGWKVLGILPCESFTAKARRLQPRHPVSLRRRREKTG